jgi:L-fucose mutarotase/ribose pyranase (RbsD/FucU family)
MSKPAWLARLEELLPALGHRNWIVIADAAYPAQTAPGIELLVAQQTHAEVLHAVLAALDGCAHVRPTILLDSELGFVREQDAPGMDQFKADLKQVVGARPARHSAHEEILAEMDEAGKLYRILVIKTPLNVPYTSVFLHLECGYWDDEAETRLRAAMQRFAE